MGAGERQGWSGRPEAPASAAARGPLGGTAAPLDGVLRDRAADAGHPLSPGLHRAVQALRRLLQERTERDAAQAEADWRLAQRVAERTAALAMLAQARRNAEEGFRAVAEGIPQPVWTCGADGRRTYSNRCWTTLTGQGAAEARDLGWLDAVHPQDRDRAASCWAEAAGTGQPILLEHRLRGADGAWRWFEMQAIRTDGPGSGWTDPGAVWVGCATDVQARKLAEAARQEAAQGLRHDIAASRLELAESEARFRAYFPICPDALFVVACMPDGRFLHEAINQPFERLTGLWAERAEQREARAFMPAASAAIFEENYRRCAEGGEPHSFVALLALPAGDRMLRVSLLPALGSCGNGATRCLLGAAQDVGGETWPLAPAGLDA